MKSTPEVDEDVDCDGFVTESREKAEEWLKMFDEDEEFLPHKDCIKEKLKHFNIADRLLIKYMNSKDKKMSKIRREEALSGVIGVIATKVQLAQYLCAPEIMFGEVFDEVFEGNTESSTNETEVDVQENENTEEYFDWDQEIVDYCQRKHLVDSKFIDVNAHNIVVNPKNITVEGLNCDKIWDEAVFEFSNGLKSIFEVGLKSPTSKIIFCISKKIRAAKYTEHVLRNWVLSESMISNEDRLAARAAYINFMTDLNSDLMTCEVTE